MNEGGKRSERDIMTDGKRRGEDERREAKRGDGRRIARRGRMERKWKRAKVEDEGKNKGRREDERD